MKEITELTSKFVQTTYEDGISESLSKAEDFVRSRLVSTLVNSSLQVGESSPIYYHKATCPVLPIIHPDENSKHIRVRPFESDRFLITDTNAVDCVFECAYEKIPKYLRNGVQGRESRMFNKYSQGEITETELSGATIIDVGARIGISSRMFIHRGASKVIAIEADPVPVKSLYKNLSRYEDSKYEIHEVALSDQSGEGTFYLETASSDSSLIRPSKSSTPVSINMMRLDELISENELGNTNILKIDAEGAEPEVLRGAEGILDRFSVVTVRASYERGSASGEGEHTLPDCKEILKNSGFDCYIYDNKKQLIAKREGK